MPRLHAVISGEVQMVGFRAFAERQARSYRVVGYVRNLPTGEVEVVAEGDRGALEGLLAALRVGPRWALVERVEVRWEQERGEFSGFWVSG